MENPLLHLLVLLCLLFLRPFSSASSSFSPADHILLNCGSPSPATSPDHRLFSSDPTSCPSTSLSATPTSLYHSAKIFPTPSSYSFHLRSPSSPHLLRLHFSPFPSPSLNLSSATFYVSASGLPLLRRFSVPPNSLLVKDFILLSPTPTLTLSFSPASPSSFAFVSALELISAPPDLLSNALPLLHLRGPPQPAALETVHRINVGGPKVTPFNDTLWRTWVPDDDFLLPASNPGEAVHFGGRIKYQAVAASRQIAPDNVYNSARVISNSGSVSPNSNITWVFPVDSGFKYLVRMHFCDIISLALNQLYFNLHLNGRLVLSNVDLSRLTYQLAAPYYADFVVEPEASGVIRVSIDPSNRSSPSTASALLNGLEIMKISNSAGSLDGEFPTYSVEKRWLSEKMGAFLCFLLGGFVFVSVLMAAFTLVSKMRGTLRESMAWSPLPVNVSGDNLKFRDLTASGKFGYVKV